MKYIVSVEQAVWKFFPYVEPQNKEMLNFLTGMLRFYFGEEFIWDESKEKELRRKDTVEAMMNGYQEYLSIIADCYQQTQTLREIEIVQKQNKYTFLATQFLRNGGDIKAVGVYLPNEIYKYIKNIKKKYALFSTE